jgi:magnesium transporter
VEAWSFFDGRWRPGDAAEAQARWFNLIAPADDDLHALGVRYGLHPLSIEDCISPAMHAPKVDEFPDHLFIVLYGFVDGGGEPGRPEELDCFLGTDFLITYQDRRLAATGATAGALEQGVSVRPGVDGLFHDVTDRLVDGILPHVNELAERLEQLQDEIVARPNAGEYGAEVLTVRATAGRARRILAPQLAVLQRFSRGEFELISEPNRIYFRDIFDHLVRIDFALEGLREDAEVALSTHLSAINNRLSEVMKVLSVVGALALPASVIAGIFGTNFDNVPGLHSNWGFVAMLGAMGTLAGSMAMYFRRKGWW